MVLCHSTWVDTGDGDDDDHHDLHDGMLMMMIVITIVMILMMMTIVSVEQRPSWAEHVKTNLKPRSA